MKYGMKNGSWQMYECERGKKAAKDEYMKEKFPVVFQQALPT
jgi:hypothetical protein